MYIVPSVTTSAGTRKNATRKPLTAPRAAPISRPATKTSDDGDVGVGDEDLAGGVRRDADDRADGQVDVAGDDDDHLPDREQQQDRGSQQGVAPAVAAEDERRALGGGGQHDEDAARSRS